MVKYCVYGYCRSTVGGYDVWTQDTQKRLLLSESNIRNTTINKMNYLAVFELLSALHNTIVPEPDDPIVIVCNCSLMYKQLCGHLECKLLAPEFKEVQKQLFRIKQISLVEFVYDNQLYPPLPGTNVPSY